MTLFYKKETIHCECGNEFTIPVYNTVNVTINPELKNLVLEGDINSGICPKCGKRYIINTQFLYHDMARRFMVWIYPESEKGKADEIKKQLRKSISGIISKSKEAEETIENIIKKGYIHEIVFGLEEFKKRLKELEKNRSDSENSQ